MVSPEFDGERRRGSSPHEGKARQFSGSAEHPVPGRLYAVCEVRKGATLQCVLAVATTFKVYHIVLSF